jgi:hypothetical protein
MRSRADGANPKLLTCGACQTSAPTRLSCTHLCIQSRLESRSQDRRFRPRNRRPAHLSIGVTDVRAWLDRRVGDLRI